MRIRGVVVLWVVMFYAKWFKGWRFAWTTIKRDFWFAFLKEIQGGIIKNLASDRRLGELAILGFAFDTMIWIFKFFLNGIREEIARRRRGTSAFNQIIYWRKITPGCEDCRNVLIEGGYYPGNYENPPEYPEIICQSALVPEDLQERYEYNPEILPLVCGHFMPKLIGRCSYCKKPLTAPAYSHKLWAGVFYGENVPVCSDACKAAIEAENVEEPFFGM